MQHTLMQHTLMQHTILQSLVPISAFAPFIEVVEALLCESVGTGAAVVVAFESITFTNCQS